MKFALNFSKWIAAVLLLAAHNLLALGGLNTMPLALSFVPVGEKERRRRHGGLRGLPSVWGRGETLQKAGRKIGLPLGMIFPPQIDVLPSQTATVGNTYRFPIPRNFAMEGFMLVASVTTSAAVATIAPEGVFSLFKRLRLTVNDGGSSRDVLNADGLSIVQRHGQYGGNLDTNTLTAYSAAFGGTTSYTIRLPHFIPPLSIEDPARSAFLLNLPRFNADPVLEVQIGTQADMDVHATPTLAFSAITLSLVTFKRFVRTDAWKFIDTDFITSPTAFTTNAAQQKYNLPVPGYHFAIGARPYSSATALGDFTQTGGFVTISALNSFDRRWTPAELQAMNYYSMGSDVLTNANGTQRAIFSTVRWWDYLTDMNGAGAITLDGLLDSNPYASIGTGPQVVWDLNGGSGKQIVFMHDRCYGDIEQWKLLPRLIGAKK
jgi:hypothetical protein